MGTFNEWVSKRADVTELDSDESIIENQLTQLVDRVYGILYNAPVERQEYFLRKFIGDLQNRQK